MHCNSHKLRKINFPVSVDDPNITSCLSRRDRLDIEANDIKEIWFMGEKVPYKTRKKIPYTKPIVKGMQLNFRYEVLRFLGSGQFANVILAKDHETGHRVAIKLSRGQDSDASIVTETLRLKRIHSSNIETGIQLIPTPLDHFTFRKRQALVLKVRQGTLTDLIQNNGLCRTEEKEEFDEWFKEFTKNAVQALVCLERSSVVHCDINPNNFLYYGRLTACQARFELADFGLSVLSSQCRDDSRGTFGYIPPEHVEWNEKYNQYCDVRGPKIRDSSVDIFALGMTLMDILTRLQFDHRSYFQLLKREEGSFDLRSFIMSALAQSSSLDKSETLIDFLSLCLDPNPETRMRPESALKHNFLQ